MPLRPYQNRAIDAVREHISEGILAQLIVMATATGKTQVSAELPHALNMRSGERFLFLVHRDELVYQAADTFTARYPHKRIGIEKAESYAGDADIVVASVQTLGRGEDSPRLKSFNPAPFRVIETDEAHHATGEQYLNVYRHFRVLKGQPDRDPKRLWLGVTATPNRSDNRGLESVADKIVYEYGIRDGIHDGFLVPILGYRCETYVDISRVKTTAGDFNQSQLEAAVNTVERNELVVREYLENVKPEGPSIFFTVDIQHAHDLAALFREHGIKVYPLSGKTPDAERKRLIRLIKERAIDGLASCGVLNEGTDLPAVVAGFMCRPTKSGLLFRQMAGRILRPFPSPEDLAAMHARGETAPWVKPHAKIVDFVDNTGRHELITTSTLFGLRGKFDARGGDILAQAEEIERLEQENPGLDLREGATDIEHIRSSLKRLDLLRAPETPPEIRRFSPFTWLRDGEGSFHLGLISGEMISVRENTLGQYDVYRHLRGVRTYLGLYPDLRSAVRFGDSQVPENDKRVLKADASWRKDPPSEKQIRLLYLLDRSLQRQFESADKLYRFCIEQFDAGKLNWTKGEISKRIDSVRAARV